MSANPFGRLFRGETHVDFAGQWRRWFALSATVILIGLISLGIRGVNFSVDFKGGTIWQVPTSATVAQAQQAVNKAAPGLQTQIEVQTNQQTNQRTIKVQAGTKASNNGNVVTGVKTSLATMAHTSANNVAVNSIGASWGANITSKAVKAVIIFLVVVSLYIWFRFEGKMAIAALVALLHDILVTVGIYSLSGFQVSPDTVIAFLTILGYSLYDTIVVFDKVEENTKSLASSNRQTYTDMVNVSMNQVLARSLNTSFVAIIPILSILVIGAGLLGATTLDDFGLALFIGLTTGAYSSIFIASPLLGLLKEREPRYREIRRRIANLPAAGKVTPALAGVGVSGGGGRSGGGGARRSARPPRRPGRSAPAASATGPERNGGGDPSDDDVTSPVVAEPSTRSSPSSAPAGPAASGGGEVAGPGASTGTGQARRPSGPTSRRPAGGEGRAPLGSGNQTTAPAAPSDGQESEEPDRAPDNPGRSTAVPPRSNRPPPRPRKKTKKR